MRKLSMLLVGVLAWALMVPAAVPAAGYPDHDITLVVPWAAGGGTDTLGRTLVKNSKKYFGVNINVVNRVGGTGSIGMNSVATGKPDGYTVAQLDNTNFEVVLDSSRGRGTGPGTGPTVAA